MSGVSIRQVNNEDRSEWLRMRVVLWPNHTREEFLAEMDTVLADPMGSVFVAVREDGNLGGFLEAGTRDYADGCETSPVGYIEGWYVDKDLRRQGVGMALIQAAEDWARAQGLTEMASDTWLDNDGSIRAHLKLGYVEAERLVHFTKKLY